MWMMATGNRIRRFGLSGLRRRYSSPLSSKEARPARAMAVGVPGEVALRRLSSTWNQGAFMAKRQRSCGRSQWGIGADPPLGKKTLVPLGALMSGSLPSSL